MLCPRDSVGLNKEYHQEGIIFSCPNCDGIAIGAEVFDRLDADGSVSSLLVSSAAETPDSALHCPSCVKPFNRVLTEGHEIDICSRCHFIWLDSNEVARLLEHSPTRPARIETVADRSHIVREFEGWMSVRRPWQ